MEEPDRFRALGAALDTPAFRMAIVVLVLGLAALWFFQQDRRPSPAAPRDARVQAVERPRVVANPAPANPPVPDRPAPAPPAREVRIYPVEPEVFCSQMAAFGIVETRLQASLGGPGAWECAPRLFSLEGQNPDAPTSIYTSIRGEEGSALPLIRMKFNELDPSSGPEGRAVIARVLRSATRSFGIELPKAMVEAIMAMEDVDMTERRLNLTIRAEREDPRRRNIFLRFVR